MNDRYEKNRKNCNSCNNSDNKNCITICECDNTAAADAAAAEAAAVQDACDEAVETRRRRKKDFCDPVCVDTNQIYDSCRDRDCVSNARVYLTEDAQELLENAVNVKLKKAEIIWVYSNVEPLSFNNGYFSVDLKFFVNVTLEIFTGVCNPTIVNGLSTFDKRVILYGSEGNSKIFKSNSNIGLSPDLANTWKTTCMPVVVVETVEPVALSARIIEPECCCPCSCCDDCDEAAPAFSCGCNSLFPQSIYGCYDGNFVISDDVRQVQVSYGLFSIVRLERDSQLLIDAVDFCIPTQECQASTEENPCNIFNDIRFPIDEFYPPQKQQSNCGKPNNSCGCCN